MVKNKQTRKAFTKEFLSAQDWNQVQSLSDLGREFNDLMIQNEVKQAGCSHLIVTGAQNEFSSNVFIKTTRSLAFFFSQSSLWRQGLGLAFFILVLVNFHVQVSKVSSHFCLDFSSETITTDQFSTFVSSKKCIGISPIEWEVLVKSVSHSALTSFNLGLFPSIHLHLIQMLQNSGVSPATPGSPCSWGF